VGKKTPTNQALQGRNNVQYQLVRPYRAQTGGGVHYRWAAPIANIDRPFRAVKKENTQQWF